jgi:hypothetical protein
MSRLLLHLAAGFLNLALDAIDCAFDALARVVRSVASFLLGRAFHLFRCPFDFVLRARFHGVAFRYVEDTDRAAAVAFPDGGNFVQRRAFFGGSMAMYAERAPPPRCKLVA